MNRFFNELQVLINKFSEAIDDNYKVSSIDLLIQKENYDKVKQQFNTEFNNFLVNNDVYLFDFIGSKLEVLKRHLSQKTIDLNDTQKRNYFVLLKKNLQQQNNQQLIDAKKNRVFLETSNPYYFLKVINQENERLLDFNISQKHNYLKEVIALGIDTPILTSENLNSRKNQVDLNHWNQECFDLFEYLYDNYYTGTKRELTNLWYYFKIQPNDEKYYFKMTKTDYKSFIKEKYREDLTNFDKSAYKFEEEINTLNHWKSQFESL